MATSEDTPLLNDDISNFAYHNDEIDHLMADGFENHLYKTISNSNENRRQSTSNSENAHQNPQRKVAGAYTTLSVLLLGVFVSQTDQSFVLATYGAVSSEFNDFGSGSWLISAYALAQCVAQPLYGKLSDIYGRKACLQAAHILFALGTAISGLGRSMGEVIAGRAIQGAGGSGIVSMTAIVITDLVPLHEVAALSSYVNILQTIGRSCGGFIGGILTQGLGWRLAFLIQVPPVIVGMLLIQWRLSLPRKDDVSQTKWEKLRRVDFFGATFICFTIFAACFILDAGGRKLAWNSPALMGIMIGGVASANLFVISSKRAKEPIFPLRLMTHYELATNYIVVTLQMMIQMALMTIVPLYFQATKDASTGAAGAYLIPAFIGNAIGALLVGYLIRRTGRYKWATVTAPAISAACMSLCLLTWNGNTSLFQSTFIFLGGLATGMAGSSCFIALAAAVAEEDIAVAGSGMYLFFNFGAIAGISSASAVYQTVLKSNLIEILRDFKGREKVGNHLSSCAAYIANTPEKQILRRLLGHIRYLHSLNESERAIVMPAYVRAFHGVMVLCLIAIGVSFVIAVITKGRKLDRTAKHVEPLGD